MESLTSWLNVNLNIIFLAIFAQILLSDSSPLNKESSSGNSACAKGWIHYERFCVVHAKGDSEAAVALYCNGFGGIGIKGYCITKAHNIENGNGDALVDTTSEVDDQYDSDDIIEEIACPEGWKHYGNICVYQPLSIDEQCHLLNSVEFSGLCLKHADLEAIQQKGLKYNSSGKEKRVCCCAHVRGKPNGYGCM